MSNRTSESNKAIALAWEQEKKNVSAGKGTRDWTPEEQKSILSHGKAYDANGRAYEGQHMRSAEKHPEYQGDPNNIQFLTRDEHLEAHDGAWTNPTNWYFDPKTKQKYDFGNGPIIPCKVAPLSEPIVKIKPKSSTTPKSADPKKEKCAKSSGSSPPKVKSSPTVKKIEEDKITFGDIIDVLNDGLKTGVRKIKTKAADVARFCDENKDVIRVVVRGGIEVGTGIVLAKATELFESLGDYEAEEYDPFSIPEKLKETSAVKSDPTRHLPPMGEQIVSEHTQHYGKDKHLVNKAPYSRGGKEKK